VLIASTLAWIGQSSAEPSAPGMRQDAEQPSIRASKSELPPVEIGGERLTSATRLITTITRDELARGGDNNLLDVLRRASGVTVVEGNGPNAEIRLRGLGAGYTRVLVNGRAAPPNFALQSLSPMLVDRVEIIRFSTPEVSGEAIAGTINIVLRNTAKPQPPEARFVAALGELDRIALAEARYTARIADSMSAGVGVTAQAERRLIEADFSAERAQSLTQPDQARLTRRNGTDQNEVVALRPRLDWFLDPFQSLVFDAVMQQRQQRLRWVDNAETLFGTNGPFSVDSAYVPVTTRTENVAATWTRDTVTGSSLYVQTAAGDSRRSSDASSRS
jgi:outer membrane receptor for ferrienterochelin and colicins